MFDTLGLDREEKYFKYLIRQSSFEDVKKSVRIGDCFYALHGLQVVVGFKGYNLIYTDVDLVKQGTVTEEKCYSYNVISFLYTKEFDDKFYADYDEALACNVTKCKLQNQYLRDLGIEMSQKVYDSVFNISLWDRLEPLFFTLVKIIVILCGLVGFILSISYGISTGNYVQASIRFLCVFIALLVFHIVVLINNIFL